MCDAQAAWNTGCNENNCIKNSSGGCVTPITDYSNPGSWCKKFQFDSNAPNNAASVVYVGNGGQVCMEGTGCDKNALDMNCAAETPAGNYTLACSPPKPNQTVGDLRYEVKVDGTAPKNFGQAVFFLSLSKNSYPNHQQGFAELTQWLGKPTWSDNCTSVDWCGYWIHQINDPDPNSNNTVSWIWDKNKSLSFSGGQQNININMIANKVKELKDQGKLPANYTMKLAGEFRLPPDFQTKHPLGEKTIDISPYACTSEPQLISREYNVTTQFVCPDGSSPTAIAKRMYWAIWPPGDVTWVPRPLGYLPGATGNSITANINFASLDTANNSSIYVAMARADLGTAWSAWSGKAYKAINPPSGFSAGTYFNPLTQMFKFPVNTTPSGSYTLKFEAPPELCAAPPPSPSPTPIQCNGECIQGASPGQQGACASGLSCVNVGEGSQLLFRCRNASYPNQTNCQPPPSPSPSPRPMCLTISMNNDAPKINDQVVFTCAQIPGATSYRFRVKEPDGNTITLAAEGNKSASYTITKSGKFIAECALSDSQGELPWPSEGDMKP